MPLRAFVVFRGVLERVTKTIEGAEVVMPLRAFVVFRGQRYFLEWSSSHIVRS